MPIIKRIDFFKFIFLLILLFYSYKLLIAEHPWIFLDNVNLLIHEGGHLVFGIFGEFLGFLGGTLMQLLVPISFFIYFFKRKDTYGTSFSLFWIGDNLINISVYIKDAQSMKLPLLMDGMIHDWNWILGRINLIEYDQAIGNIFYLFSIIFFMMSIYTIYKKILLNTNDNTI